MWILLMLIICGVIALIGWLIDELLKENNITCSFCEEHAPVRQSTYINDVPKEKSRDDIFLEKLSNIEDTHSLDILWAMSAILRNSDYDPYIIREQLDTRIDKILDDKNLSI